MTIRTAGMTASFAAFLWGAAVSAEPAPAYSDLLARANQTPTLEESASSLAAAQARLRQAGSRPNPTLMLEAENFAGKGPYSGWDGTENTLTVSQPIELGGKRGARLATARAGLTAAEARNRLTGADYAAQLAVAYAEAEAAGLRVGVVNDAAQAAEADARAARELVSAGREAELRALQAEGDASSARADVAQAMAGKTSALARLAALAGQEASFDGLSGSVLDLTPAAFSQDGEATAVQVARAEADTAFAAVRAARADRIPDLTVSAGVRQFSDEDTTALVAGVSVPLPLFGRTRAGVDAARAEQGAAEARLRQAQLNAAAARRSSLAEADAATARVAATRTAEGAATEAYRLARIGYEAGRVPLLELSAARRALAGARNQTIEARLAHVRAVAERARLAGVAPFGS